MLKPLLNITSIIKPPWY